VNKDGTVNASSGLADPSANVRTGFGTYFPTFNRDVSSCAWNVSRASDLGLNDFDSTVQMTAFGAHDFNGAIDAVAVSELGMAVQPKTRRFLWWSSAPDEIARSGAPTSTARLIAEQITPRAAAGRHARVGLALCSDEMETVTGTIMRAYRQAWTTVSPRGR